MLRDIKLEDITDGKFYFANDLVKTDTQNCTGCKTVCCKNMGNTIVLDPYDIFCLTSILEKNVDVMIDKEIALNLVDGIILPNLKMNEDGQCYFLNDNNMCNIHKHRPGVCRMFPLGRYWEDNTHFYYILQVHECNKNNLTKTKVKKWLGIDNLSQYEDYIVCWHDYLCSLKASVKELDTEKLHILNAFNLKLFFMTPYKGSTKDFYDDFYERIKTAKEKLSL